MKTKPGLDTVLHNLLKVARPKILRHMSADSCVASTRISIGRSGKGANGGRVLDFHSFRHSYVSSLDRAGLWEGLSRKLARASSRAILERYTHREFGELAAAVESLPAIGVPVEGGGPADRRGGRWRRGRPCPRREPGPLKSETPRRHDDALVQGGSLGVPGHRVRKPRSWSAIRDGRTPGSRSGRPFPTAGIVAPPASHHSERVTRRIRPGPGGHVTPGPDAKIGRRTPEFEIVPTRGANQRPRRGRSGSSRDLVLIFGRLDFRAMRKEARHRVGPGLPPLEPVAPAIVIGEDGRIVVAAIDAERARFCAGWSPAMRPAGEDAAESAELARRVRAEPKPCWFNARRAILRLDDYRGPATSRGSRSPATGSPSSSAGSSGATGSSTRRCRAS